MIRVLLNGTAYPENFLTWQERKDVIARSEIFWGVVQSKSLELQFYRDAYDYIKQLDDDSDIAAECTINIQSQNQKLEWIDDFVGLLDFSPDSLKYDNQAATKKLTINAYSSSFSEKILERLEVEIPYDRLETLEDQTITPFTNEYYEVYIDGIEAVSGVTGTGDDQSYTHGEGQIYWTPSVIFETTNVDIKSTAFLDNVALSSPDESNFFYVSSTNTTVKLNFQVEWYWDGAIGARPYIYKYEIDEITRQSTLLSTEYTGELSTGADISTIIDIDISLEKNQALYFTFSASATGTFKLFTTSELLVTSISLAPATPCNFVPPFEAGHRILEAITGQTDPLDSPYLGRTDSPITYSEDGDGSLFFFTNGKLIRQFPTGYLSDETDPKKAQLAFSLKDWFESLDKIFCLGAGVKYEDGQYKFYVDDRREFFKNEASGVAVSRDELEQESFTIEKIPEYYFNEIEIGSTYEQPEEVSGLEEYNAKQKYSSPILHENKLELLNKYIYAAYPFEFARRLPFDAEETTDYKYDNDNFIFNVERYISDYIQLSDTDFEEINGLENVTTYINLNITPKRNLKRHGWFINTGLRGYQTDKLKYNKSDITTDLSTRKISEAEAISENADVLISDLDTALLTGRVVSFNAPVSSEKFKTLQNNPYGLIEYYDPINEAVGYGFLKEVSTTLTDKTTNWQLYETKYTGSDESFRLLQDGTYRLLEDGGRRLLEN